jgi:hypothetical protein
MNDLPSARALAYDIIYNGVEVLPVIFLSFCMLNEWKSAKFDDVKTLLE